MQKFNKNDLVMVTSDNITVKAGTMCIILGSYNDLYPGYGGSSNSYSVFREGLGEMAWMYDSEMELVERNRPDILEKFKSEYKADVDKKSNLDWIFSNGNEVLEKNYGASIQALANCFGMTNLWGRSGEGVEWIENARKTMEFAYPFLLIGDKEMYLEFCKKLVEKYGAKNDHTHTKSPASKHANARDERGDPQQDRADVALDCHMEDFTVVVQSTARAVERDE